MRRLLWIPICAAVLLVPVVVLAGGGDGFDGVVHSIESKYHVRATRIPFMGLVSMVARGATHQGVSGLHVAEFDSFSGPVDGQELNRMVEEKLGPGWERIIRETSKKGNEQTLIFVHPEGEQMGLFIVDRDGQEMDVVQVSVDPEHLNENIGHYRQPRHEGDDSASDSN
jgi:hypothetical protein